MPSVGVGRSDAVGADLAAGGRGGETFVGGEGRRAADGGQAAPRPRAL